MASNTTKWSRKRSIEDDSQSSPILEKESTKKDWKVKTLDEILQEKRRRIDNEPFEGDSESLRQSAKSSVTSSPVLQIDSRASSKNQSPTQEVIYLLSPEHGSPLSTSSETNRKKTANLEQKGRRKTDEEDGEILSDISDPETGGTKQRSRISSRHVSTDVEMVDKPSGQGENITQEQEESEEESEEEDTDSSSEEEQEEATDKGPEIEKPKSSEEEEESSDSSEESEDSSEEEDEEKEVEEIQTKEQKINEEKVDEKVEESSEDESEEDSDDESESDDSDDSSEEDEKEQNTLTKEVEQKNTNTVDNVDSKVEEEQLSSSTNPRKEDVEKPTNSREKEHSAESSSQQRKHERSRQDGKESGRKQDERSERSKKDRKKDDIERASKKHKSSSESSDYKKLKDSKSKDKDRDQTTRSRERSERHSKEGSRGKRKELKSSKEETKSSDKNRDSNRSEDKSRESKAKTKESAISRVLTQEERLQFASEVVDTDSDDHESVDDSTDENSDNEEPNVSSQSKEAEEEEPEEPKLPDYLPAIQGCRIVDEFTWLNRIEEGTYGVVYRARDKRTNEIVALKRLKMEKEKEGFPITSLREINTLLKGQHPNIVTVREVVVGKDMDKIFIVMDYVEHDLKTLMEHMSNKFAIGEIKTLLVQLLRAVTHLHDNWILHRDLKTSNLLLSNKGILKVADFGLAREYGSPLKPYTPIVVTLWYRAPELLLGVKEYSCPIDLWSVGCIFAELLTMKPLFPGKSEIDQINRIFKELGTPSDKIWPGPPSYSELPHVKKMTFTEYPYNQLRNKFGTHLTDKGFDLLNRFLTYDPNKRITAEAALKHEYFNESPYPIKPDMFPTWPAKSEMQKRPKKKDYQHSPKAPEGGEMFSKLKDGGDSSSAAEGLGFHMPSSKKGSAAVAGFSLKFNLK